MGSDTIFAQSLLGHACRFEKHLVNFIEVELRDATECCFEEADCLADGGAFVEGTFSVVVVPDVAAFHCEQGEKFMPGAAVGGAFAWLPVVVFDENVNLVVEGNSIGGVVVWLKEFELDWSSLEVGGYVCTWLDDLVAMVGAIGKVFGELLGLPFLAFVFFSVEDA